MRLSRIVPSEISIHALREESDVPACVGSGCEGISIHALREESDGLCLLHVIHSNDFNPRSP